MSIENIIKFKQPYVYKILLKMANKKEINYKKIRGSTRQVRHIE